LRKARRPKIPWKRRKRGVLSGEQGFAKHKQAPIESVRMILIGQGKLLLAFLSCKPTNFPEEWAPFVLEWAISGA
jgi:hypothetical protein